jgi:hypothetical protein
MGNFTVILVVIGALLVVASGIWVAIALVVATSADRDESAPQSPPAGTPNSQSRPDRGDTPQQT